MVKRYVSLFLIFTMLISLAPVTYAADMEINARAYVLMEPETGKVIMENKADDKLVPASITKIMTILLIYEALRDGKIKLTDIVTVSEHAAGMGGSQVYLEPFEQQTVEDMLKCVIVASANDASVAMAEFISGSEEEFVKLMNQRAIELGMANTHFVNSCGLDTDNHYTSARDVAIMTKELINNFPDVHNYTKIWQDSIIHKTKRGEKEFVLTNTNKLVKWYEWSTGLKTGSTSKALYCLSGTAQKDNLKFIAVIMGAPDYKIRFREAMKLFDYGFANFKMIDANQTKESIAKMEVVGGKTGSVDVYVGKQLKMLMNKTDKKEIESVVNIDKKIYAPTKSNAKVGEVIYKVDGKEIGRVDIVTKEEIEKAGWKDVIKKMWYLGYLGREIV